MYSLLTVLHVVYAIVQLSSGKLPGISFYFYKQSKMSLGKYVSNHLTFD